ncbi:hypothetical protein JST97_08210 [bacterium]|nr:hypothetical protein [bacterium]
MRQRIAEFVSSLLKQRGRPAVASGDQSLFLSGLLDSMDAMQVILFMEAEFQVDFGQTGFSLELIDSLDKMTSLAGPPETTGD